jgi:peptidoglycan/LPS O-acetylase OafA/YrhL
MKRELRINSRAMRKDILAFRAVAILLVILCHLEFDFFRNGYIGVDFFFVISGYLMMRNLLLEYDQNAKTLGGYGWIDLRRFYSKRFRRIFPAAFTVSTVTLFLFYIGSDSLYKLQLKKDYFWSLISFANLNLIQQQQDYFRTEGASAPFLHFWSLSVEEQFYFSIPLLFMFIANFHHLILFGRRFGIRKRLTIFFVTASTITFLFSITMQNLNFTTNFYSFFARFWEFGLGIVAALSGEIRVANSRRNLSTIVRTNWFLVFVGVVIILANAQISNYLYFLPIILIPFAYLLRITDESLQVDFRRIPKINFAFQYIGTISYSLYLWHWPVWLFVKDNYSSSFFAIPLVLASTFFLAALTEKYIERPIRKLPNYTQGGVSFYIKSRRYTSGMVVAVIVGLAILTYQPVIGAIERSALKQPVSEPYIPPIQFGPVQDNLKTQEQPTAPKSRESKSSNSMQGLKYLAILGDSTNTCCSDTGAFWPRLMANKFGWVAQDYSVPGSGYLKSGLGSNGCSRESQCPAVGGQANKISQGTSDAILISTGIHDCFNIDEKATEFESKVQYTFTELRIKNPNSKIIVSSLLPSGSLIGNNCAVTIDGILEKASKKINAIFVPNVSNWIPTSDFYLTRDLAHLNDRGHEKIAQKFVNYLTEYIKK